MFESLRGQWQPLGAKQRSRHPNNKNNKQQPLYLDDANDEDDDADMDMDHEDDEDDEDDEYDDGGGTVGLGGGGGGNHFGFDIDGDDNHNDDDDAGTIHPFGPHIDPKLLVSTDAVQLLPSDGDGAGADFNPAFKRKLFSNIARTHANIGKSTAAAIPSAEAAQRPGAPRDVVAQIVNPRFVALNWLEPATHPDEVTSYTVYYKMTTSER